MMQLSILCDADVGLIIFSSNGKLYQYASGDMDKLINKYTDQQDSSSPLSNHDVRGALVKATQGRVFSVFPALFLAKSPPAGSAIFLPSRFILISHCGIPVHVSFGVHTFGSMHDGNRNLPKLAKNSALFWCQILGLILLANPPSLFRHH
jgi:hypothetical protein